MTTETKKSPIAGSLTPWLAEFNFPNADSTVVSRIQDLERWASAATIDDIANLIALVIKLPKDVPPQSFTDKMRGEFRKSDPEFPAYGNDREMEVLAGMMLYSIMTAAGPNAALCALSVLSASAGGARAFNLPAALPVELVLNKLSELGSQRPDFTKVAATKEAVTVPPAIATLELEIEALRKCLLAIVTNTQTALSRLAQRADKALSDADRFLRQQDEELQILWWYVGRRSHFFNRDIDDIPSPAHPFVFAIDLAEYISILPGPVSIQALLSRAGLRDNNPQPLTELLAEVEPAFLQPMVNQMPISPVTHPLHFAIERKLEHSTGDGWKQAWGHRTKLTDTLTLTPHALALQLYRERLLLKWAGA